MAGRQNRPQITPPAENQVQSIFKDPVMKWIFRALGVILVIFITLLVFKALRGQHVKFLGFEVNEPKPKIDTVVKIQTVEKKDTIQLSKESKPETRLQPFKEKKPEVKNEQKIDSGSSGIQNNASNYGPQAGRDMTININEKLLTQKELIALTSFIESEKKRLSKESNCVNIMSVNSTPQGIVSQIRKHLESAGYSVNLAGYSMSSNLKSGIVVDASGKCVELKVQL